MTSLKGIVVLALTLAVGSVSAHQHWETIEIKTQPLRNGIYALYGEGGNLAVSVGEDGTFMVDDQYAPLTGKILAAVTEIGGDSPKFLVNTHWHFDHSGGNENLGEKGAVIVAHDHVREQMAKENGIKVFDVKLPASPKVALPVITFGDELRLHFNDETVEVVHVPPAHTDGDSTVRFINANIVHTGDLWFNGLYPFIDTEHGGSLAGMVDAANTLIGMVDDDTLIIPGHGPVGTKAELIQYREMLQTVLDRLRAMKKRGLTLAEVIAEAPTSDYDAEWGKGFLPADKWLAIVYSNVE